LLARVVGPIVPTPARIGHDQRVEIGWHDDIGTILLDLLSQAPGHRVRPP
jgi:hypothetical protein